MIVDEEKGRKLLKQIAEKDVTKLGYAPLPDGWALVEGYSEQQIDIQDRLGRILYGAILSGLANPVTATAGAYVFANAISQSASVILAETGWNDEGSERRIEVKRSAG
ncbi:hypothetical protein SEA_JFLIX2_67 [Rhodococcus phage Jflix2]|nr:hypothetical protein SEA_JFLIX2_67 [Rhodococcus phage Jflix2]